MPNNHRTRKWRQEPLPTQPAAIETWNTQFTHLEGVWRVFTTNEGSRQTPGGRRQRQRFLLVQSPFVLHSSCTQLIQEWLLGECSLCIDPVEYCIFPAAGMDFGLTMCTVLDAGMTLSLLHKYCQFFWMQIDTIQKHQWGDEFVIPWTGSKPFKFLAAQHVHCSFHPSYEFSNF